MTASASKSLLERLHQGFWLTFLFASLSYAWYAFYAPSNDIAWEKDFKVAQERASESNKSMVLFVTATWCSPCRIMKRQVWADEGVKDLMNRRFIPVLLDADDPAAQPVLQAYGIQGTPCTLVVKGSGEVMDYRFGAVSKSDFMAWMRSFEEVR